MHGLKLKEEFRMEVERVWADVERLSTNLERLRAVVERLSNSPYIQNFKNQVINKKTITPLHRNVIVGFFIKLTVLTKWDPFYMNY